MNLDRKANLNKMLDGGGAIEFHSALAGCWEQNYKKMSCGARLWALEQLLANRDLNGKRWLDAGCGTGTLSRRLAGRGAIVLGVDASAAMVRTAATVSKEHPQRDSMQFDQIDSVEQLDAAASSFDGVLCSSVLEYLEDPGRCLSGFRSALREGGLLVISVPNAKSVLRKALRIAHDITNTWPSYMGYSRHQYFISDFETLLGEHGFNPLSSVVFGGPFPVVLQKQEIVGNLIMFMAEKRSS